jgi:hypothetical protein
VTGVCKISWSKLELDPTAQKAYCYMWVLSVWICDSGVRKGAYKGHFRGYEPFYMGTRHFLSGIST